MIPSPSSRLLANEGQLDPPPGAVTAALILDIVFGQEPPGVHIQPYGEGIGIYNRLDKTKGRTYDDMIKMLTAWREQAAKLEAGEITKEEYDRWRYRYLDTTQRGPRFPPRR